MNYVLDMYRQMCVSLKRGNTKGVFSNAKPIFMLSVIDYITTTSKNELLWGDKEFEAIFLSNFSSFDTNKPTPLWKPFFYMSSEPFYTLEWKSKPPEEKLKRPSAKLLKDYLAFAQVDEQLWEILQDNTSRVLLRNSIINQYFK